MRIGFSNNNSVIHRLNPSLKFIAFVVIIVMIFLPLGFFAQIIIGTLLLLVYIASKLSFRKFWNILKSVIFLFLILLLVNWVIYKSPIAIFLPFNHFAIKLGSWNFLTNNIGWHATSVQGESFVSQLFGGNILGFFTSNFALAINGKTVSINEIINDPANLSSFQQLSEGFWMSLSEPSREILKATCNGSEQIAKQYLWILRNQGFVYEGYKYSVEILANSLDGIANPFSAVVYQVNWYTLSPKAFQLAIYVSVKVFLMILVATILTSTTSSIELAYALEDILSPLKAFKFPVVEASMMIAISLRFTPSLLSESQRILNAQSARGVDFKNGSVKDKFKAMISLVVPLFNIAFLKSSELANAMEARSYSTRHARSRYRIFKLHFFDWFAFAILCFITGFLIGIMIKPLIFTPFGIFELAILVN